VKNVLSENTLVPISFVVFVIGGMVWLTTIYAQGSANQYEIEKLRSHDGLILDKLDDIQKRLSRIEGHLEIRE